MSAPGFAIEVSQNEYLPARAREVHAIVTVISTGPVADQVHDSVSAAEVIIVDCSGSMGAVIGQAIAAAGAAIDAMRDGVAFAVVAGARRARAVYPEGGGLAIAGPQTRQAAKQSLTRVGAGGGTAIGRWLLLARDLFVTRNDTLRHAILLTDGVNAQLPGRLESAIKECEGQFRCDCRGVGTHWKVDELRKISDALLGTVDIVPDPAGLAADFEAMMTESMAKQVADVALRVWVPEQATIRFVRQVAPTVADLSAAAAPASPQVRDYPTGAWGTESRDYHVCVDVAPAAPGQEMLAARVSLIAATPAGPQALAQGLVRAIWTADDALSAQVNDQVAHYTGQSELASAIREGLQARKAGDEETATARLGRAVALARESGNEDTARLLAQVVDVVDPATGTVRLKAAVADADEMALDTRSTKTVRVKK